MASNTIKIAVEKSIKTQDWQIKAIKNGLAEANAGSLIDHADIVKRWQNKVLAKTHNQKIA